MSEVLLLGLSPFERPDPRLVVAVCRAGALGVLDLGRDIERARDALSYVAPRVRGSFGVRIPQGASFPADELPAQVDRVVLPAGSDLEPWRHLEILVQVTSADEAQAAITAGANALILKGHESGGRVGEESAFVLLQRLAGRCVLPLWVQGGVGLHTAAACVAGGATGVVLDSQLALVRESSLPPAVRAAVSSMDGSETVVLDGYRVYQRPDLPIAELAKSAELRLLLGGDDLQRQLLPAGQDASFAEPLARRFRTAGGVLHAIRERMRDHVRAAIELRPLAPDSPLARAHGIRYPIAQGPMTRVSDRAAFAEAVAEAGGLPFLALSLLSGKQARPLLEETAALLGDRPWGVGILGFVPPELREEQLAAVQAARPSVALIAGGRPSQARPLEEAGIATYLHVPSPGLLDLFLKDGARRFVFEGRECGGHVGPRSSFVLWEAQVERLLGMDDPSELSLLFAGGIHDGRSAAMVSALAAPLAARGAKVGVLMGTAYLFTHEAVASGAILPGFQEAAVACEQTALLETAPGHATRCVETPFVEAFRKERARLESEQTSTEQMWATLEQLNLGRLRVAAKGVRREGDDLVEVDADTQRAQGMYMIGQVAALRHRVISMAELHAEVCEGSTARLASLEAPPAEGPRPRAIDVAIIGMAGVFPDAPDLGSYWANIVEGVDSIREVPASRWSPDIYYDPESQGGRKTYSKVGGFLPDIPFDPLSYGIPPRSLAAIDPAQLLALEVTQRALADAGYADREFDRNRTSVIFGTEAGTDLAGGYGFRAMYPQFVGELPAELDATLPSLTEDSFPGVLGNVIAGRIANRLDLGGVNYTVDAACASSLAAIDVAIKELAGGTSDMVLCGGADLHNGINDYLMFCSVHALSRAGRCATFDASADGTILGEGVATVVLKRLSDAERDGDRIYAVIKGVAGGSDGRFLGLTAPRQDGQVRSLDRAYERTGISPAEVGLVEAHGTGTVVGDRTELATLTQVYGKAGAGVGSCTLGSVKSQIGHTKCAAGLAGLIKVALSLYHSILPPTLHVRQPNPFYDAAMSPFTLTGVARPWVQAKRVAGVSAFGFGGTNFHAIVSAYDQAEPPTWSFDRWPAELFLFHGADRDAAIGIMDSLAKLLDRDEPWRLRDLARSVNATGTGPVQVAVVATDTDELRDRLTSARAFSPEAERVFVREETAGQVAFLFPGQGSQRPNMLRELFVAFPALQRFLRGGLPPTHVLFPPSAFTPEERASQRAAVTDTRVAQPALGIVDLAMCELLGTLGLKPDLVAGHSYGELVALCVAGALDEDDLPPLSEARGRCILGAADEDPGTMAAVSASPTAVEEALSGLDGVVIANYNAPDQTVISGTRPAVEESVSRLEAAGVTAREIPVACAFHSPVVAAARDSFGDLLAEVAVATPNLPVWSNTTAEPYPTEPDEIRRLLADQVAHPVRFAQEIEAMYESGARVFVEAGPGRVLTGLVRKILGDRPHAVVACDEPGRHGLHQIQIAVAQLAALGLPVRWEALHDGRDSRSFSLTNAPSQRPAPSCWLVDGMRARPLVGEPPPGALRPATRPVALSPVAGDRDAVMVEYLRGVREMVESQREVMLRFLGAPAQTRTIDAHVDTEAPVATPLLSEDAPDETVSLANLPEVLLEIVSERTGYPAEMLDLDLDLEADLSIDSIKRIEILGVLGERLGMEGGDEQQRDEMIEQLAARKSLRAIIRWFEEHGLDEGAPPTAALPHAGGGPTAPRQLEAPAENPVAAPADEVETPIAVPTDVRRFTFAVEPAPLAKSNGAGLDGRGFVVTDDGRGIAAALARLLEAGGATARILGADEEVGESAGLIHLGSLAIDPPRPPVKELFELVRGAVAGGATTFIAATGLGGAFGRSDSRNGAPPCAGVAGLLKSLAKESAGVRVRIVDLDPSEAPEKLAEHLYAEIISEDDLIEVGYRNDVRQILSLEPAAVGNGESALELDDSAVVLVTGGARGITAQVARSLAVRFKCKLELVGRSPLPDAEDPALAEATDATSLRRILIEQRPKAKPARIEARCARILADREIRATLAAITEAGVDVRYHAIDVRDEEHFELLLDEIYEHHGRLDGVIHGAGVIEDKLLRDKTPESFDRVFDTKAAGALTLARKLRDDVRFVVFFASVSGAFGNRGQIDYAAANDFLDKLAWSLRGRLSGRVVSIDWGPWAGLGMVSPQLEREYARRGIGLIPLDGGVEAFVQELMHGEPGDAQVVLMRADPAGFR